MNPSDRRYQVFVSSTFTDLQEERQAVMQALLKIGCLPTGMEFFPASGLPQLDLIKPIIDDSDYYVLLVGGRYGEITESGISYTEQEFNYALDAGKTVLAFIHEAPDTIPLSRSERDPKARKRLDKFRARVKSGRMVDFYKSSQHLGMQVIHAVEQAKRDTPAEGWVRGREVQSLHDQIRELQQQLESAQPASPDMSTALNVEYTMDVEMGYLRSVPNPETDSIVAKHTVQLTVTWERILVTMGVKLMEEGGYYELWSCLARLANDIIHADKSYRPADYDKPNGVQPTSEAFTEVLTKLMAHYLIESVESAGPFQRRHWRFTRSGVDTYLALKAVDQSTRPPG